MTTKYDNADSSRLARTGGALVVAIDLDPEYGPLGVHPESVPCMGCWISPSDADTIVSIGTGRDPLLRGVYFPTRISGGQPMWIPVSDVSQLYFSGDTDSVVNIVYLVG